MTAPLPNPSIQAGRATCSGPHCPLWNPRQAGWCTVTMEPGQRDKAGAFRLCRPYHEGQAPVAPGLVRCRVQRLPHARGLALPSYETAGAAGMDVRAAVDGTVTVWPGQVEPIPTGLVVAVPEGWQIEVRPRSGLAARLSIDIANSPGTIDSDYRWEVKILVHNNGHERFDVSRGDRIAQLVLMPAPRAVWSVCEDLVGEETGRGAGGLGSTGVA